MNQPSIVVSAWTRDQLLRKTAAFFRLPRKEFRLEAWTGHPNLLVLAGALPPSRDPLALIACVTAGGGALNLNQLLAPEHWGRSHLRECWNGLAAELPPRHRLMLVISLKGMLWATTEEPAGLRESSCRGGVFVRDRETGAVFLHRPYKHWLIEMFGEPPEPEG